VIVILLLRPCDLLPIALFFKKSSTTMVFSGVLSKMGSVIPNWKARFFVLDGDKLTYFESEGGEQKGQFILTLDTDVAVSDSIVVDYVFVLQSQKRTLYMSASSEEDLDGWVRALENSIKQLHSNTTYPL
jgi:hypothetical protein